MNPIAAIPILLVLSVWLAFTGKGKYLHNDPVYAALYSIFSIILSSAAILVLVAF